MVFGEERFFESEPASASPVGEFILRYVGADSVGLKMKGKLPVLWKAAAKEVVGPMIYDDEMAYTIVQVDYARNILWIRPDKLLSRWRKGGMSHG